MANTTPSIYMSLPVPVPTVDPGPQFATDLNSCLTILDSHTHSSGSGQQITPAGISINQNLAFFNNNAISLRSARFQVQNSPISNPSDLDCVYVSGVDLYYNDNNGNQVRLTQNGGVAGTPGSIGGLANPASVNYLSGSQTFVFQSSTATPANLDCGAIIIRDILSNSKGITIAPPAALANNYSITFPGALPSTGVLLSAVDTSGNISFISNYGVDNVGIQLSLNSLSLKDSGVSQNNLGIRATSGTSVGVGGIAISESCGSFSTNSTTYVNVTNLSVTLTTKGRPVILSLQSDGSTNASFIESDPVALGYIAILQDSINIGTYNIFATGNVNSFIPNLNFGTSVVAAGTHTYSVQAKVSGSGSIAISFKKLYAYEI